MYRLSPVCSSHSHSGKHPRAQSNDEGGQGPLLIPSSSSWHGIGPDHNMIPPRRTAGGERSKQEPVHTQMPNLMVSSNFIKLRRRKACATKRGYMTKDSFQLAGY
ncbi:hypothetical protein FOZ63_028771 [Perkinsus olseni]|uniref:Uncharacterized protein n=1 Tax=Perkinsus olseni TaxID=32597 RepID=A0A7J6QVQ5_PEROL|nr:hypothetical protein FOZ63_028771 [Perkinsus olseni]